MNKKDLGRLLLVLSPLYFLFVLGILSCLLKGDTVGALIGFILITLPTGLGTYFIRHRIQHDRQLVEILLESDAIDRSEFKINGMTATSKTRVRTYSMQLAMPYLSTRSPSAFYHEDSLRHLIPMLMFSFGTLIFGWWSIEGAVQNIKIITVNFTGGTLIRLGDMIPPAGDPL